MPSSIRSTTVVDTLMPFLQLSLHGMPREDAEEQLAQWHTHLELLHRDRGPVVTVGAALWSSFAHLGWRVTMGPPSALLPGLALLAVGFGTGVLALLRPGEALPNLAVFVAATVLGTVLVRYPCVQPRTPLAIGTALCVPVNAAYAVAIASDIWVPSDWFIVAGTGIIAFGMLLVSLGAGPVRVVELQMGRSWGFGLCSVGAGAIAVAEIDWLRTWSGTPLLVAKLLAAAGTLIIAFTAWRIREIPQEGPPR